MSAVILVFIGMLIWQLICLIVLFVSHEDEEATIYTAVGIWMIPIVVIEVVYKMLRLMYYKHYYDSYFLMHNSNSVSSYIYMSKRMASKFNCDDTKEYYIKKTSDGKSWKSAPFIGDVYRGGEVFKGHTMNLYKKGI